jgi:hypothetical protein
MHRKAASRLTCLLGALVSGCFAPAAQPIDQPIAVRVVSADSTRSIRFALDVTGGEAELRAPQMHGRATDARLIADTPAEVVLHPGTTAASFRALGDGRLEVSASAPKARLRADGVQVRISSTGAGLSIRDY